MEKLKRVRNNKIKKGNELLKNKEREIDSQTSKEMVKIFVSNLKHLEKLV